MKIKPITDSVKAKVHDPVYTVHRYFARRPHNVINNIIQHYTRNNDSLVFDPFGGGGTMLYESLVCGNRAIACDTSDLACFIIEAEGMMASCDVDFLTEFVQTMMSDLNDKFRSCYEFANREVYWLAWSSYASCPHCNSKIHLSPENSLGNGNYNCKVCKGNFKPKCVHAENIDPIEICCMDVGSILSGKAQNPSTVVASQEIMTKYYNDLCHRLIDFGYEDAMIPKTEIPDCNLQRESALHKKGFNYFEQFIPKATRAIITYMGTYINDSSLSKEDKRRLLFVLSASLRYCSRFSCMNVSWRGEKRPMEWVKSNFWTPYTFVEVNPMITFFERWQSYIVAVKSAKSKFTQAPIAGSTEETLKQKTNFTVLNKSSENIPELPDACVDLIVTDPPYGSYLHYGELSAFWTTWLSKFIPNIAPVPDRTAEAVPARKKGYPGWKNFNEYESILTNAFSECYRLLKDGSYCVVTFNNKEPEAWIAFLRSVKRAGFLLPDGGVIFQDGVEIYKKTIDSRRGGSIFGDFIYSFYKDTSVLPIENEQIFDWRNILDDILQVMAEKSEAISNNTLYTTVYFKLLPQIFSAINTGDSVDDYLVDLSTKNFEAKLKEYFSYQDGAWISNNKANG